MCEKCVRNGDKEFSYATYDCLKKLACGEDVRDTAASETIKNCLRFFAYYVSSVAGVTLKCLPQLISVG